MGDDVSSKQSFIEGHQAITICDTYWIEYPKPSKKGHEDELAGRAFVDGYVQKIIDERSKHGSVRDGCFGSSA